MTAAARSTTTATPVHHGLAPDFAAEVLEDLYTYRRRRRDVAWVLWAVLGWVGAHRFYLERPGTGLLMLLSGGGALVWWVIDAFKLNEMVADHNEEQARREREGEPPLELAFMPAAGADVLREPPEWTVRWQERGRIWRGLRLTGDLLVLLVSGTALGALAGVEGGAEAAVAVIVLIAVTMLGGYAAHLDRVPVLRALLRWSHRLRLFYYFNRPGSPPALLFRGFTAMLLGPFRRRDRAEVRLYLELGAAFTAMFLVLDVMEDVVVPLFSSGLGAVSPLRLAGLWIAEGFMTFLVTYAFAAPVGAVLTLYLLTRPTHALPRVLGVITLVCMAVTAL